MGGNRLSEHFQAGETSSKFNREQEGAGEGKRALLLFTGSSYIYTELSGFVDLC